MKAFYIVLFVLMVAAQWFVPLSMVVESESLRTEGALFRFETQPIDPTDPFRGKYITLRYAASTFETTSTLWHDTDVDTEIYLTVANDSAGFAKVTSASRTKPTGTEHYFKARLVNHYSGKLVTHFPFERFYLEESKAKDAENVYNENNRDEQKSRAYAEVYIKDGKTYLHDVKIDGESLVDIVRKRNDKIQ
ncbi:MAG TPA: GDYXXLXY domain-containing protein [Chryseosolibacter sp.]